MSAPVKKPAAKPARKKPAPKKKKKKIVVTWKHVALAVLLLGLVVAVPYGLAALRGFGAGRGAYVPEGYSGFCLDISHYQEKVDWPNLRLLVDADGRTTRDPEKCERSFRINRVYIKATEGESIKDKLFHDHWEGAASVGMRRGAYHFYIASKDPAKQAANYVSLVGALHPSDLPPVVDVEDQSVRRNTDKAKFNRDLKAFLDILETTYGRRPWIYTNESFLKDYLDDDIVGDYTMWIARYSRLKPSYKDWKFWQFTDRALVSGIPEPVDLSVIK